MTARAFKLPLVAAFLGLLTLAAAGAAFAGCNCTPPPPPPCNCKPPAPPTPPSPCCSNINIPGVNVNVGANVVVNANAQSFAFSGAGASSGAAAGAAVYYGGGGYWSMGEGPSGLIQNLNVESEAPAQRVAYEATRTRVRLVIIQAVCIDDKEVPHPASQVTPDRDIDEHYEGELYRCIAGTHMEATMSDYHGAIAFDHAQTITCVKDQALYRSADGRVFCRRQIPARNCNERSLLRRYGAGVKIVKIVTVEKYTAYREVASRSARMSSFNMTLDGGVGGVVH